MAPPRAPARRVRERRVAVAASAAAAAAATGAGAFVSAALEQHLAALRSRADQGRLAAAPAILRRSWSSAASGPAATARPAHRPWAEQGSRGRRGPWRLRAAAAVPSVIATATASLRKICLRTVGVSTLKLLQLPLCGLVAWGVFGTSLIPTLEGVVVDRPALEIAMFSALALVPYLLARLRLVADGMEVVIEQMARLLAKVRGRFSVASHVILKLKVPLVRITQNMLYFMALNLFVNAVPEGFQVAVPRLLRCLDKNGDGTLEAKEIEESVYAFSSHILGAFFSTHFMMFLIAVKKPPEGWDLEHSKKREQANGKVPLMEKYWQVTAHRAGWWTLLDRVITGVIWIAMCWTWLIALGIDGRTVATAGGAGGLALGLAAQQVVGNGVAALIILATAPCKVGDCVEVGYGDLRYKGRVQEIGWNSTAIVKEGGHVVYVPNGTILETPLVVMAENGQDAAPKAEEGAVEIRQSETAERVADVLHGGSGLGMARRRSRKNNKAALSRLLGQKRHF